MTSQSSLEISLPTLVGGRAHARDLFSDLPDDLSDQTIVLDASMMRLSSPSYLDEVIAVLVERRKVAHLVVVGMSEQDRKLMSDSCARRDGLFQNLSFR